MLVALAVTLLMMGAVITVFGFIGERVTDSRALIETTDRMRSAAHLLREDLTNITVDAIPWQKPEAGAGYLEIMEGQLRDYVIDTSTNTASTLPGGDVDDLLLFTVRSPDTPYRGKFGGTAIESNTAEVVWYCRDGMTFAGVKTYNLCRRQLLVVPDAVLQATNPAAATFYDQYDVSAHAEATSQRIVANTLGDLTKRENRFRHGREYPHHANLAAIRAPFPPAREGEEVVLSNVLSFDVQVFDPGAEVRSNGTAAVEPRDPGYAVTTPSNAVTFGAYVDLGDNAVASSFGRIVPEFGSKSRVTPASGSGCSVYDTWSFHYEQDGVRQPGASILNVVDAGTNGLDDNPQQFPGVDDMSERETSPPYPYPLRGLRVKIRVYEPSSKQVREETIVQSFVPE